MNVRESISSRPCPQRRTRGSLANLISACPTRRSITAAEPTVRAEMFQANTATASLGPPVNRRRNGPLRGMLKRSENAATPTSRPLFNPGRTRTAREEVACAAVLSPFAVEGTFGVAGRGTLGAVVPRRAVRRRVVSTCRKSLRWQAACLSARHSVLGLVHSNDDCEGTSVGHRRSARSRGPARRRTRIRIRIRLRDRIRAEPARRRHRRATRSPAKRSPRAYVCELDAYKIVLLIKFTCAMARSVLE